MKLALFGGASVRPDMLQYGKQTIDQSDIDSVVEVLKGDYLTTGPYVKTFENDLTNLTKATYAQAVANGTVALHAACFAAGIGQGDEVIVPSISFVASANCVRYLGGTVIFADIEPNTLNIDIEDVKRKITKRTKAIILVDLRGNPANSIEIAEFAKEKGIVTITDAAHSIGASLNGKMIGEITDMTTFSFHPVKTITTGEGGAIVTNNKELYEKVRLFSHHGIVKNVKDALRNPKWYYEQIELGYNFRLTDIQAALGSSQLKKIHHFIRRRDEIIKQYNRSFINNACVELLDNTPKSKPAFHLFIIKLRLNLLNCTRDEFFDAMIAENIGVNIHYFPINKQPYYKNLDNQICRNAEAEFEKIITLPLFPQMTDDDVSSVISAVNKVTEYYKR